MAGFLGEDFVGLLHPPVGHPHGDPADHDADGRGEWDPIVGEKGVEGEKLAEALCGW